MKKISLLRYSMWLLGWRMFLPAVFIAILMAINVDLSSSVTSILPTMMAAMFSGQRFARDNGQTVPANDVRRFAFRATLIGVVVEVVASAFWGVLLVGPEFFHAIASVYLGGSMVPMIGITVFLVAVMYFGNRFFVSMGAKNELKAAAKRAQVQR
ncbi:ABZJ_00895 family protein [Parasedimentitalea huanghaiensis]|uniref:Transmembrane protein n=1 Tax=Parasedimentitalea huanghaiensis TaxID=2682100 RepID=A0A6L6WKI8_9RHOB|nr:ABZJ_00895 family protein [Zongyanglinia huanghaiensis]MVO17678.1 hypothetical protein [Zongyanglinia huanghaiensis]